MSEMVDRIAAAIARSTPEMAARAVLSEMRVPSPEMLSAMNVWESKSPVEIWQMMIDAELKY